MTKTELANLQDAALKAHAAVIRAIHSGNRRQIAAAKSARAYAEQRAFEAARVLYPL